MHQLLCMCVLCKWNVFVTYIGTWSEGHSSRE